MLNKLKPYFYLLLLFVLTGGMFDDLFNIIFTLLLFPFIIISPIFVLKKVKSKFIIVILMLGLFVALISMLQSGMVSLEGRLFGGSAIDNSFVFTIKTLVKIMLLFIFFPVSQGILQKFSNLCFATSKIIIGQIAISTILYNFLGFNKIIIKGLYPLISGFTWHEQFPFLFMGSIFSFLNNFQYCRPLSIFREPGSMGIFLLFLFIIYSIINKKFNIKYFSLTILGLIIGLSKAALILAFMFLATYTIVKFLRSKAMAIIVFSFLFLLGAQFIVYFGGEYFAHRSMGSMYVLNDISLLPKGLNSSYEYVKTNYGEEANLGFVSMLYDLGIILSIIVYSFLFYLLIKIYAQDRGYFAIDFAVFAFLLGTFGLSNMYFSGLFLFAIYLFVYNFSKGRNASNKVLKLKGVTP